MMRINNDYLMYVFIGIIVLSLLNANFMIKLADAQISQIRGITGKAGTDNPSSSGYVGFNLTITNVLCPEEISVQVNDTNSNIILNWDDTIQHPNHYNIFADTNLSRLKQINSSTTPLASNITGTSWTDTSAGSYPVRYYMISPVKGDAENRNCTILGKCTQEFVTGNNLFSLCMNKSETAQSFMQSISHATYRPSVLKLERPNNTTESWISVVKGFGGDFDLIGGKGYYLTLDHYENYTIAGYAWPEAFTLSLKTGNNLIGIDGNKDFTAQSLMNPLTWTSYRASMLKLERPNANSENWTSIVQGIGGDFDLSVGKGYYLTLDHDESYTIS